MEIFKLYGSILVEDKAAMNSLQKVDKEGGKLAGGFGKLGKIIAGAFSVAAIVGFGKKVVEASADLQAMEAQFDQVFKDGENSQAVERIGKQVEDLGINADRLTDSWNKFGGQVKGAGMESEQALEAVDKATRLAADSAAFYDVSLESSSASLASFMKGNFAAGDAIGVFTNAKQMDVKSNDMYGKSWANLTEAERQWLLLDTVEKTYEMNGAMGQASREAGSYENVMGNLRATFKRLWATIGEPVLEGFLVVVQNVTGWIEANMPLIETTITNIFEGIKTAWNDVLEPVFSVLWNVIKAIFDFIVDNWPEISATFQFVFDLIELAWTNILKPVLDVILDVLANLVNFVKDNFPGIQKTFETVFDGIGKVVETAIGVFEDVTGAIKTAWDWLTKWNKEPVQDKEPRPVHTSPNNRRILDGSNANGLAYVPFDGYISQLHKGEEIVNVQDKQSIVDILKLLTLNNSSQSQGSQKVELVVNLDGRTLARELYDPMQNENKFRGTNIAMGVS